MKLSLGPAAQSDFAFCESLQRSNMSPYLSDRGIAWDPDRYLASWAQFENLLISADGQVVGLLRLLAVDGALEIRDLQLLVSHRRRGIGSWAVKQAQSAATARGFGKLRLRVYAENPARQLYARLGFMVDAIDDGTVHMSCALPPDASMDPIPVPDTA